MMYVIEVFRDRNVAYVAKTTDHYESCPIDGEVKYGQACLCPKKETNCEVPLDRVEAQLRDPLPDGYQEVWVRIKNV